MTRARSFQIVLILLLARAFIAPAAAENFFRWVQYVPAGLEVRAAIPGESSQACPSLRLDGAATPMQVRAAPGEKYPVTICAAAVPAGTSTALIDGLPLPLPKENPSRILLIGDTGCRVKDSKAQACNSLSQWPFRLGADMAAFEQPDLVIHVGDYHYRETACPLGNYGCSGTPYGDNWDVWRADFFAPAESLLNAAPWIFVRGNHEDCTRGGMGWARALSPASFDPARGKGGCLAYEAPFVADIGVARVIDMDVALATEEVENPEQVADYGRQLALAKDLPGPVWVAMHRPAFAEDAPQKRENRGDNKTLAAALRANVASRMEIILSGHHHTFEAMNFGPDLPAQIVSGEGGDSLSPFAPRDVKGMAINGATVAAGVARPGVFGFAMLERASDDTTGLNWTLTAFDTRGQAIARCKINGRSLDCE